MGSGTADRITGRPRWMTWALCLVVGFIAAWPTMAGAGEVSSLQETYAFSDRYPVEIAVLGEQGAKYVVDQGLDVDQVDLPNGPQLPGRVRAYVNDSERASLESVGFAVTPVPNEGKRAHDDLAEVWRAADAALAAGQPVPREGREWPTYAQLEAELQAIAAANPNLVRLVTIGSSLQGRAIYFLKISDNAGVEENEPEFKFSSSIHGDEVVGMELCRRMIHYLLDNYGTDPTVTNMVNNSELWFCCMYNPDGFVNGTRYNAHGVDLNRDFPDPITDPIDTTVGRELENQNMMNFCYPHNFILSANYHGGSLVMNIPWDCQHAHTPDHNMIWQYAEGYSYRNPPMWASPEFPHGVVLGADWYVIHGGLQDWSYNWRNDIDITIEVSNNKWPAWSTMDTYWANNRDAMLYYMERVLYGVKGRVYNAVTGAPLSATVMAVEIGKAIKSDAEVGDYHRILLPGTYTFTFTADGYDTRTVPSVVVTDGIVTTLDAPMYPVGTDVASGDPAAAAGLTLSEPTPNPIRSLDGPTHMTLAMPQAQPVSVGIFDVAGREIAALTAPSSNGAAGTREVSWDARSAQGQVVAPGIYWVRAVAGDEVVTRRVVVIE
jgi:hypothetical protein